jgi:hypothetical protein
MAGAVDGQRCPWPIETAHDLREWCENIDEGDLEHLTLREAREAQEQIRELIVGQGDMSAPSEKRTLKAAQWQRLDEDSLEEALKRAMSFQFRRAASTRAKTRAPSSRARESGGGAPGGWQGCKNNQPL